MDAEPRRLTPLFALDIAPGAGAAPVAEDWPEAMPRGEGFRWIHCDMADPALEAWLADFLPPLVVAALVQAETRPRCDLFEGGVILNLRGVNLNHGAPVEDMVSLRLWVQGRTIVTVRLRKLKAVEAVRAMLESGVEFDGVGAALAALAEGLTERIETVSLDLADQADALEEAMLTEPGGLSARLAAARLTVIKLRRFLGPQREAMARLARMDVDFLGARDRVHLAETTNAVTRSVEELDATRERLAAVQDHLDAHLGKEMARNGYLLSIVAAVFLPLGFLTGLFGVNVGGMPGVNAAWAFGALTGAMVVAGLGVLALLRWLRWI